LAGGQLLTFGSHGKAHAFNPASGEETGTWKTNGDVAVPVAIANETLYTVSENGRLTAWK
jgi:hypothetical protein